MIEESTTPDLVRIARQAYEAVSRGDFDAVMSLFAADAVYELSEAGWGPSRARRQSGASSRTGIAAGRNAGLRRRSFSISGTASCFTCFGRAGRLVGGDGRVEQRLASLATWANGKIEWLKDYRDIDQARADAERLAAERR
jgi:ketosteroid isomerase-like protein